MNRHLIKPSWKNASLSQKEVRLLLKYENHANSIVSKRQHYFENDAQNNTKEFKQSELRRIEEMYRFVEFGRLSSGIFHDILNPLTALSLSVEEMKACKSARTRKLVEQASRASKQMESFIQIARKQLLSGGKKEEFCPEKESCEAIELLRHKSNIAGVELCIQSTCDAMSYGNPVRFFRIIVNLISNAIDSYAYINKSISKKIVHVTIFSCGRHIVCEIKDQGCGIPRRLQKVIFEPFFTTKEHSLGMGLGLSTAKDSIEQEFGGTISLSSISGKGSVFTVSIPAK